MSFQNVHMFSGELPHKLLRCDEPTPSVTKKSKNATAALTAKGIYQGFGTLPERRQTRMTPAAKARAEIHSPIDFSPSRFRTKPKLQFSAKTSRYVLPRLFSINALTADS